MQRNLDDLFQFGNQFVAVVRGDDPGHILDDDAVGAHRLQRFRHLLVVFQIEDVAAHAGLGQRIAHCTFEMLLVGLDPLHAGLEVPDVI